ncbi:MAG: glycerol-3-phosphate 1-O-acyltransferase PlsY [Bacteroidetes bacterium]|jgi:glycerol-3-phosphate acyltransferase PlsY|nr:glycerol-3-phosphate 1-O-acyltransferase PlsY [Bacteroidota bacterium]
MELFFAFVAAYAIGSTPTAVWAGKLFAGIDVRRHGSGNAGATNTLRVLGPGIAIPVLLIDIAKGLLATRLVYINYFENGFVLTHTIEAKLLLGIAAVVGHIFPIFAQFRGGKGIATFFGIILGVHVESALLSLGIFIVVVSITRFVSLGSILAAILYPIQINFLFGEDSILIQVFSIIIPLIVLYTHRKNIDRLLKGEESKIRLIKN